MGQAQAYQRFGHERERKGRGAGELRLGPAHTKKSDHAICRNITERVRDAILYDRPYDRPALFLSARQPQKSAMIFHSAKKSPAKPMLANAARRGCCGLA